MLIDDSKSIPNKTIAFSVNVINSKLCYVTENSIVQRDLITLKYDWIINYNDFHQEQSNVTWNFKEAIISPVHFQNMWAIIFNRKFLIFIENENRSTKIVVTEVQIISFKCLQYLNQIFVLKEDRKSFKLQHYDYAGLADQIESYTKDDKVDNKNDKRQAGSRPWNKKKIYNIHISFSKHSAVIKNNNVIVDYVINEPLKKIITVDDKCQVCLYQLNDIENSYIINCDLKGMQYCYIDMVQEMVCINDDTELIMFDLMHLFIDKNTTVLNPDILLRKKIDNNPFLRKFNHNYIKAVLQCCCEYNGIILMTDTGYIAKYCIKTDEFETISVIPPFNDIGDLSDCKLQEFKNDLANDYKMIGHGLAVIPNILENMKHWIPWKHRIPEERMLFDNIKAFKTIKMSQNYVLMNDVTKIQHEYDIKDVSENVPKSPKKESKVHQFKFSIANLSDNKTRLFYLDDHQTKVVELNNPIKFIEKPYDHKINFHFPNLNISKSEDKIKLTNDNKTVGFLSPEGEVFNMSTDKQNSNYDNLHLDLHLTAIHNDFKNVNPIDKACEIESTRNEKLDIMLCDIDLNSLALIYGVKNRIKAFSIALNLTVEMKTEITYDHHIVIHNKFNDQSKQSDLDISPRKIKRKDIKLELIFFLIHENNNAFAYEANFFSFNLCRTRTHSFQSKILAMLYYGDIIQVCLEFGEIHILKTSNWISFVKVQFIWNQLTTIFYFSPFEVYSGIKNGDIQYIHMEEKTYDREQNFIFKFHSEPVTQIIAKNSNSKVRYILSCDKAHNIAFWDANNAQIGPQYTYSFIAPIQKLVDFQIDNSFDATFQFEIVPVIYFYMQNYLVRTTKYSWKTSLSHLHGISFDKAFDKKCVLRSKFWIKAFKGKRGQTSIDEKRISDIVELAIKDNIRRISSQAKKKGLNNLHQKANIIPKLFAYFYRESILENIEKQDLLSSSKFLAFNDPMQVDFYIQMISSYGPKEFQKLMIPKMDTFISKKDSELKELENQEDIILLKTKNRDVTKTNQGPANTKAKIFSNIKDIRDVLSRSNTIVRRDKLASNLYKRTEKFKDYNKHQICAKMVNEKLGGRPSGISNLLEELQFIKDKTNVKDLDLRTYQSAMSIIKKPLQSLKRLETEKDYKFKINKHLDNSGEFLIRKQEDEEIWDQTQNNLQNYGTNGVLSSNQLLGRSANLILVSNVNNNDNKQIKRPVTSLKKLCSENSQQIENKSYIKSNFFSTQDRSHTEPNAFIKKDNVFSNFLENSKIKKDTINLEYTLNTLNSKATTSKSSRPRFGDRILKTCGDITNKKEHPCNLQYTFDKKHKARDCEDQFEDKAVKLFLKSQRKFRIESNYKNIKPQTAYTLRQNLIDKH